MTFPNQQNELQNAIPQVTTTTLGKIPNEMYYLEDTMPSEKTATYGTELHTLLDNSHTTLVTIGTDKSDKHTDRFTLIFVLLTALLVIILLCCITACVIAKSKSKHSFFSKSDIECSPGCSGINQPLLSLDKASDTTSKTSSIKN